jgi:AraC-like DNA-binding protein
MDALSTILCSLRLRSSILSRARLSAPWAIESPDSGGAATFHVLVEGRCWVLRRGDDEPTPLGAGDVIVITRGDRHVMSSAPRCQPVPHASLRRVGQDASVPDLEYGGGGELTRIICGNFQIDHDGGGALLDLLPPLLHAPAGDTSVAPWVDTTLRLLDAEIGRAQPGVGAMLTRLADVLFMQVLRSHFARGSGARGWFAAVQDPAIGRALSLVHEDPGGPWTASELGARVGLSRTRFFERFTELVGEPPARYVARWRVHAATDLMRRQKLSTAQIAERMGYASEDAFTKVFKRHVGVSPSVYRRRLRQHAPRITAPTLAAAS